MSSAEAAHLLAESWIEKVYASTDGNPAVMDYMDRHEVDSMLILTVASYYAAQGEVQKLLPHIEGKTVVEIGAGVGMLALQMARYAKHVWAIESDPAWSWIFTKHLYELKPPNLTWIFGRAQDLVGVLHADVAVVYTRSNVKGMGAIAKQMAPELIRGPLVEFDERYGEFWTAEQLAYAKEISSEAMLAVNNPRGLDGDALRAVEAKFRERFPDFRPTWDEIAHEPILKEEREPCPILSSH